MSDGTEDCTGKPWTRADLSQSRIGTWKDCKLKYHFQYIERLARKNKVFFPQGQVVHYAIEKLIDDHQKGLNPPVDYYLMELETMWQTEIEKGELYDNKGKKLTAKQVEKALADCKRWVSNFIIAVQNGDFKDYDLKKVKAAELDIRRQIPGTNLYVRGKVDWVEQMNGSAAKMADLKTASTHWMGAWTQNKADIQLQATTYGWIAGIPLEFTYVVIYKTDEGKDPKFETLVTRRDERDYVVFMNMVQAFLRDTNYQNGHDGFTPYPEPEPTKYGHCGKLCDFKDECYKRYYEKTGEHESNDMRIET